MTIAPNSNGGRPAWLEDYRRAVERGAWFPLRRTLVKVRGRDRIPFLHNLCTADVRRLQPGSGCEAFFLNVKGQVVAAAQLFVEEHQLVLESSVGLGENLIRHLEFYRIREDVQFEDATDALAASLLPDPLGRQCAAAWGLERNSPMDHGLVRVGGVPVALRRNDAVGPPGVECVVARADRPALEQFLSEQGIAPAAAEAWEALRIEWGVPGPQEFDEKTLPQEVPRHERALSFTKGCYLGQETVARLDALGHVNRRLVGLQFDAGATPAAGMKFEEGGRVTARVTSATWSPRLEAPLAWAYVRAEHEPGAILRSPIGSARVVSLPLKE